ncbi:MAG: site-specific integrase [Bacteroidetes bacterium]|nr:site-specific integrase [Bacteroidota bacterium]
MKTEAKAVPAITLDTSRPGKDGRFPVRLRVTYKRKSRFWILKYPAIEDPSFSQLCGQTILLTKETFKAATKTYTEKEKPDKKLVKKFEVLNLHFATIITQAKDVVKEMIIFSFDNFEANYFNKPTDKNDLFSMLDSRGKEMRSEGRISTAVTFECAVNSLKDFSGKEKLPFERVTVKFLRDYEKWMLTPRIIKGKKTAKPNSRTTVGIYLRNVRTIFNSIKPVGVLYPFGKSKEGLYQIPKGKNKKKALTQADVAKIAFHPLANGTIEERSRDLWLFSYLCNGINIKDVARLRYSNIDGDKIILVRAKTAESAEEEATIEIIITRQIGRIIDRWGTKPTNRDEYIFQILKNGMTPQDEYRSIKQAVQTINNNMETVCKEISIDRVTTYGARHSFATVLKRSGASIEFISESLGHRNKQTTQSYLANFEDEEKRKWAEMLLPESND